MRKLFILLAAVAFAFAFTTPAAAEVNFSGMVSFETYMASCENDTPGSIDEDDLIWALSTSGTRLTANFKEGPVSGLVEIRANNGSYYRHWFASWNFGAGTFGIGQTWTPEFSCIGSVMRGDGVAGPLDPACSVRIPFVQLRFGGLNIGLGAPSTTVAAGLVGAGYDDTETSLPKLMASYSLNVAMVGLKVFGGYNTVAARNSTNDQSQDVDSYVYGVTASAGFGPLTVKGMYWGGQNTVEYGAAPPDQTGQFFDANWTGTTIQDTDMMAYGVDVSYKVSDMISVAAGYQAGEQELDAPGKNEDETVTYFLQASISLAKGVTLWPEYAVVDRKDVYQAGVKTEQDTETWIGVYWRIAF
jgi:hypothetical protein